ncbi:MAG: hypothetical protein IPK31_07210 [Chitinophagaceae bacterium]|nr:hypothetical protein [Chitinophagaceae bacterium]
MNIVILSAKPTELVEGGVITHVYPLKGNESVIGFNILTDSARKSGAILTILKKTFYIRTAAFKTGW